MSNNVVPYNELTQMAEAMAKSQLFGMKTADQVIALMLVAQANNQHPAAAARDFDIIQGRPAKKAEAMLRDFLGAGGSVQWHKLDNGIADATFSHPAGGSMRIDWTMKRAAEAGLGGKEMWKKWPRQMLRSRCISEGVRTVFPVATGGMYAPEEIQDFSMAQVLPINGTAAAPAPAAAPSLPPGRYDEIESMLANCESFDQMQLVWAGLSKDERKATSLLKEQAKSRLSEEAA